ncbi:MAG: hypothetical protein Q4C49_07205 [Bacillota bacterium]|nr:hypothetical protein [Bacillota bacterium]
MEQAKKIIQTKETTIKGSPKNLGTIFVRIGVIVFLIGLILYGTFINTAVFDKMTTSYKAFLSLALFWALLAGNSKKELQESNLEIRIFEDKMELYRKQRAFSNGKVKRTSDIFYFSDIKKITYDQKSNRIIVQGKLEDTVWEYKNGKCEKEGKTQIINDGFDVIDLTLQEDRSLVTQLQENIPLIILVNKEIDLGFNKAFKKKK